MVAHQLGLTLAVFLIGSVPLTPVTTGLLWTSLALPCRRCFPAPCAEPARPGALFPLSCLLLLVLLPLLPSPVLLFVLLPLLPSLRGSCRPLCPFLRLLATLLDLLVASLGSRMAQIRIHVPVCLIIRLWICIVIHVLVRCPVAARPRLH